MQNVKKWEERERKKDHFEYAIGVCIAMRFEQGAVEQVAHAASEGIVFYNLLHHVVEYWTCIYEFNDMLVWMLNYIEMDVRV